jgi:Fe-Mn family superoxide dismutase
MFVLPDLPYAYDALEPTMSADTLHLHHDKHHAKYVETVNQIVEKKGLGGQTLEDVVRGAAESGDKKLFNNAGQAWNHGLLWVSMTADRTPPSEALNRAIEAEFGGLQELRERFVTEGADHFGSGWVWLTAHEGHLDVTTTHDGDGVLTKPGIKPLLVCDLWEHAYYLDFKNDRKSFLEGWFDNLADWAFAARQFEPSGAWTYPTKINEQA